MPPFDDDEDEREARRRKDAEEEREYWDSIADQEAAEEAERVTREQAIERMVDWFFENFEDPQNETPYDSEEGAYIYMWGGPFDASEMIGDSFSSEYRQSWIEDAVARVEADGTVEWAPNPSGEFYEHPEPEPEEEEVSRITASMTLVEANARLAARVEELEGRLARLEPSPPEYGHNRPPPDVGVPPYDDAAKAEIRIAINIVQLQVTTGGVEKKEIEKAESTLRHYAAKFLAYAGKKADMVIDETIKTVLSPPVVLAAGMTLLAFADDIAAYAASFLP